MLVLSRLRDESVMIGQDVEVKVVDIRGDKVRLGFSAPNWIAVDRTEVFLQKQANQRSAGCRVSPEERQHMDPFLRAAIDEAMKGLAEGGLPIGSVLVRNGQIIGRGHNRRVQHGDPMAHAEIDCLTNAGRQRTYADTVLYSTLMPCYLCTGAAVQFGVPKVVVGESVNFVGGEGKWGKSPDFMRANGIELIDLHDAACIEMMSKFIRENPQLWNEDIGAD
ncbi:MAG: cytosine/creatinine deaminase [Humisphaera sp.]|nr:cytosine/creatinine deaminase [Humisphaera sp.]